MSEPKRVLGLILVMTVAALSVTFVAVSALYRAAIEEDGTRLEEMVRAQARLIEAVARFDAARSELDHPGGATAATLSQIADAFEHSRGMGRTGELVLVRREADAIVLVAMAHSEGRSHPQQVRFDSAAAEPFRRALSGQTGRMIGPDYRGESVLAAYASIKDQDFGLVAKIEMAELRAPFLRAGGTALGGIAVIILLGAWLQMRLTAPMLRKLRGQTADLAEAAASLERRVAERTSELSDANQRLEAEARERAEAEESYLTLLESAPDAMIVVDPEGEIVLVNVQTESLFGYSRAELVGRSVDLLLPEPLRAGHAEHRRGFANNPSTRLMGVGRELRALARDGTEIPVDVGLSPHRSGKEVRITAAVRDVTERKQAEEILARRAHELAGLNRFGRVVGEHLLLDQLVDEALDQVSLLVAPDLVGIFRQEGEELIPVGSRSSLPEGALRLDDVHRVGQCLCGLAATESGSIFSLDIHEDPRCTRSECKAAGLRSFAALPLKGAEGLIGVLGVASFDQRDFAAERTFLETLATQLGTAMENALLYRQLRQHAEVLEEQVAERTSELAIAKEKAEESDRLKSAFLATMSHELRTPLNSIIGFTGILVQGLAGPLNQEQEKQLGMVQGSARHLLDLINDVLDISKIEAGQLELHVEPFDMRAVVERVANTVGPIAEKAGLGLRVDLAPEVGRFVGDRRRVEQILLNLANNAIKFTERGEVRIACRVRGDRVLIQVADTGIGIKPEDIDKLFREFQQLDGGLSRNREGTGLGLAICKKLASLMGGEIRCESEHGKGSTFSLALPLTGGEPIEDESPGHRGQ